MAEFKKTICFDFDGVCATYDTWRGVDIFGEPVPGVADLVKILRGRGYHVILWTTRKMTPAFLGWLVDHGFEFDSINACDHNPPDTSIKPIAEMYVDDRAYRFEATMANYCCEEILQHLSEKPAEMDDDE